MQHGTIVVLLLVGPLLRLARNGTEHVAVTATEASRLLTTLLIRVGLPGAILSRGVFEHQVSISTLSNMRLEQVDAMVPLRLLDVRLRGRKKMRGTLPLLCVQLLCHHLLGCERLRVEQVRIDLGAFIQ